MTDYGDYVAQKRSNFKETALCTVHRYCVPDSETAADGTQPQWRFDMCESQIQCQQENGKNVAWLTGFGVGFLVSMRLNALSVNELNGLR